MHICTTYIISFVMLHTNIRTLQNAVTFYQMHSPLVVKKLYLPPCKRHMVITPLCTSLHSPEFYQHNAILTLKGPVT